MIMDPSRVLLLGEYATVAESGSETELGAREAEVRLFIEALWSQAGASGRRRFMEAVGERADAMPWVAVRTRTPSESSPDVAPPAIELLLDSEPMGDEGVAAHRLDMEDDAVRRVLEALRSWDTEELDRALTPSGWSLGETDESSPEANAGTDDAGINPEVDAESGSDGAGDEDPDGALVLPESVTAASEWWPWALAVGGLGAVGTALWLAFDGEE